MVLQHSDIVHQQYDQLSPAQAIVLRGVQSYVAAASSRLSLRIGSRTSDLDQHEDEAAVVADAKTRGLIHAGKAEGNDLRDRSLDADADSDQSDPAWSRSFPVERSWSRMFAVDPSLDDISDAAPDGSKFTGVNKVALEGIQHRPLPSRAARHWQELRCNRACAMWDEPRLSVAVEALLESDRLKRMQTKDNIAASAQAEELRNLLDEVRDLSKRLAEAQVAPLKAVPTSALQRHKQFRARQNDPQWESRMIEHTQQPQLVKDNDCIESWSPRSVADDTSEKKQELPEASVERLEETIQSACDHHQSYEDRQLTESTGSSPFLRSKSQRRGWHS
eukprot:gnl/TRDRNA2_/TRDRNA2_196322_c0_seq1.p1 gnl/TRDRNA2_/TRDRNA2_196322_c0~~gnl/TRDRNA2_/TRDRNA2_196322_c0_seq1.p1  ORF type:complete len:334 (-),score=42.92 gnl/TRDRNA2_/TRDRNA2_196322_c0_seq1:121-1122(-)